MDDGARRVAFGQLSKAPRTPAASLVERLDDAGVALHSDERRFDRPPAIPTPPAKEEDLRTGHVSPAPS